MIPRRQVCFLLASLCLLGGCSVDVKDDLGPRVPIPNVTGTVLRDGQMADDLGVALRDAASAEELDITDTDSGSFEFVEVPAGHYEVKISGDETGDFDSVSREFTLADPESIYELPDFDIWAHGAQALEPEDSVTLPRPNIFSSLLFRWMLPEGAGRELDWVRVRLYDNQGDLFWSSEKDILTEIEWNGIGNEGDHANEPVPPGSYYWRLKLAFVDSLEARIDPRELVLE